MINFLILAAGKGSRLITYTKNKPKCLVEIDKISLLQRQINIIKLQNKYKIYTAVGYKQNKIKNREIHKIFNSKYASTNMLYTLFYSLNHMPLQGDLVISYGDIVYENKVLQKLLKSKADFSVCVDLNWKKYWSMRFDNPLDDAESLKFDSKGYLTEIGQKTNSLKDIMAQYIGLIKIKKKILKKLIKFYLNLEIKNKDNLFLTDLIQLLIKKKWRIKSIPIKSGWLEIDNLSDINLINKLKKNNQLDSIYKINE